MSGIYEASAELAKQVGIDAAIEIEAQCFDALFGEWLGVGDVLRDAWRAVRAEIVQGVAGLSGAAHELEFYGGER